MVNVSWRKALSKWVGHVSDVAQRSEKTRKAKLLSTKLFVDKDACVTATEALQKTVDDRNEILLGEMAEESDLTRGLMPRPSAAEAVPGTAYFGKAKGQDFRPTRYAVFGGNGNERISKSSRTLLTYQAY